MKDLPLNWIKILEKFWSYATYLVAVLVVVWLFYFFKNAPPESSNTRFLKMQQEIRKLIE
jgi:hypothetical protein